MEALSQQSNKKEEKMSVKSELVSKEKNNNLETEKSKKKYVNDYRSTTPNL